MAASHVPIQVTLRCSDRLDEYDTRTFALRPGAIVQIGRASKNTAKPELMIGLGNAFIDSPTISREHAVLTATSPPAPCVHITDKGSMHGTMVNGNKLEPQKAHRLSNGDVLQFGADVTRENLFYTARSFTFESSLPSYPNGFSVPEEIESSDEEEVEVDETLSCPPRYGTQTNPVDIEDVEDTRVSEAEELPSNLIDDDDFDDDELDKDLQDTTIPLDASEDTQERSPSADVNDQIFYPMDLGTAAPNRYAFVDDASSEDDVLSGYSSEDDQASHVDSCASVFNSDESQSDGDMELEDNDEEQEEEDRAVVSIVPPSDRFGPNDHQFQLLLLDQQNKKRLIEAHRRGTRSSSGNSLTVAAEDQDHDGNRVKDVESLRCGSSELGLSASVARFTSLGSSPSLNTQKDELPMLFTPSALPASKAGPSKLSEPEARMDPFFSSHPMFDDCFGTRCFGSMDSAIPPRPAAPRPMQWGIMDYSSPFSPPVNTPTFPVAYSSDMLGHYPAPPEPLLPNPYAAAAQQPPLSPENAWAPIKSITAVPASGVQTPPRAPSEDSSPPVRRTEVSIREIVEDTIQQPPTPTSVTGGLKRKAEVLDEAVEEPARETPEAEAESNAVAQDVQTVEVPAAPNVAIDQRPKKKLRVRIGSAAKSAAAWTLPGVIVGAAASVAFLTSVPNDFFVA